MGTSLLLLRISITIFCLSYIAVGIYGIFLGGSGVQAANSAYPDYTSLDQDTLGTYNSRLRMFSYGWATLGCTIVLNAVLNVIAAWRCNERLIGFVFGMYVIAFCMAIVAIIVFEVRLNAQETDKDEVDVAWEMLASLPQSSISTLASISFLAALGVALNVGLKLLSKSYKRIEQEKDHELDEVFSARTDSVRSRC
ncbi:hypothetical protein RvY_12173 [Ramazzottius varieornatus]|uniref:Uncharacterized protein n=1 Tax=Ramazzottius varieornatus TaxID=947166 RepID=A0A1D1VR84_RAMVA|nr:hypothetical protein RvY_12173 [Ramazzottius varieornatus]